MSMEQVTIEKLYDLKETIAEEIFQGKTYPWEVLPLIGTFIENWERLFLQKSMTRLGKISGWQNPPALPLLWQSMDRVLSERMRRSVSALLSGGMLSWAREPWWEILRS